MAYRKQLASAQHLFPECVRSDTMHISLSRELIVLLSKYTHNVTKCVLLFCMFLLLCVNYLSNYLGKTSMPFFTTICHLLKNYLSLMGFIYRLFFFMFLLEFVRHYTITSAIWVSRICLAVFHNPSIILTRT